MIETDMDRLSDCGAYLVREVGDSVQVFTIAEAAKLRAPPGCVALPLTRGYIAIIDVADEHLAAFKWHTHFGRFGKIYAKRNARQHEGLGRAVIYLHRAVLGVTERCTDVDHKDNDGLNCRRKNLRAVTHAQNMQNLGGARANSVSGILGVSQDVKWAGKWRARIRHITIGYYDTKEEATAARLAAEKELFGIHPRRAAAHATEASDAS